MLIKTESLVAVLCALGPGCRALFEGHENFFCHLEAKSVPVDLSFEQVSEIRYWAARSDPVFAANLRLLLTVLGHPARFCLDDAGREWLQSRRRALP